MTSTSHANERGSAQRRRERRERLVADYGVAGIVVCWLCGLPMELADVTVDRVVPGILGGTYAYANCRPACLPCNLERGGRLGAWLKAQRRAPGRAVTRAGA